MTFKDQIKVSLNAISPLVIIRLLYNFAQRCSINRGIPMLGECGSYGQMRAVSINMTDKGK